MGCCAIKNTKVTTYTYKNTDNFKDIRENLVQKIRDFQKIIVDCIFDIETCLIEGDKQTALLLKLRKNCVKNKQEEMQWLVEKIDDYIESPFLNVKVRVEIEKKHENFSKSVSLNTIFQKDVKIKESDASTIEKVTKEILECNLNQKDIEAELENEIQVYESKIASEGCIRRKYIKSLCEE